jgi:aspartate/methionine/tyrosine aminotransferase
MASSQSVSSSGARFRSDRIRNFTESVIREMTRRAIVSGAVNLSQGFPDFAAPEALKRAAAEAVANDHNQYSITWGAKNFREAIAKKYRQTYGMEFDPEREITVCCGATEGMIASMLAVINPGDEVVVFEPFYENSAARSRGTSPYTRRIGPSTRTNCAARSLPGPKRSY